MSRARQAPQGAARVRARLPGRVGWALLAGAAPGPALAHGSAQGLGAFWNGVVHPVTEPAQLLALLALGLWLGVQPPAPGATRRTVLAGALALGAGLLAAALSGQAGALADSGRPDRLLQALGLLMALATAADWRARPPGLAALAGGLALLGVALASPAGTLRGLDVAGWAAGVAIGSALTAAYAALGTRWVRQRWAFGPIVPRVLASWLAASLLLVLVLPLLAAARPAGS